MNGPISKKAANQDPLLPTQVSHVLKFMTLLLQVVQWLREGQVPGVSQTLADQLASWTLSLVISMVG